MICFLVVFNMILFLKIPGCLKYRQVVYTAHRFSLKVVKINPSSNELTSERRDLKKYCSTRLVAFKSANLTRNLSNIHFLFGDHDVKYNARKFYFFQPWQAPCSCLISELSNQFGSINRLAQYCEKCLLDSVHNTADYEFFIDFFLWLNTYVH